MMLHTRRMRLRDFTPEDFEAFYATTKSLAYRQFYSAAEMSREHWQGLFARILAGSAKDERKTYQFAMCLPDGTLIGTCGLRLEPPGLTASFGCAIARPWWGQGYAFEAAWEPFSRQYSPNLTPGEAFFQLKMGL